MGPRKRDGLIQSDSWVDEGGKNPTNKKKYKYFFMQGADIREPTLMEPTVIAKPVCNLITPTSCLKVHASDTSLLFTGCREIELPWSRDKVG